MKQTVTKESVYKSAEQSFGLVPPMIKEIAEHSVAVASLYVDGVITMQSAALTELEINAIELRISSLNGCESCVKGHSYLAKKAGLAESDIKAITAGQPTTVESVNRIIRGTDAIFHASRSGYKHYLEALDNDNFTQQEVFEIIGLLSLKTISNNINNYLKAVKSAELVSL
jgi:AhpD family alkylhydroperoxidase